MLDFRDEDKYIYGPYPVGRNVLTGQTTFTLGDPLRIYRTLILNCRGDINQVLADKDSVIPAQYGPDGNKISEEQPNLIKQFQATDLILQATRAAFQMEPFNPETGGATDALCMSVFDGFLDWLNSFDSAVENGPSLSPTTEARPLIPSPIPSTSS